MSKADDRQEKNRRIAEWMEPLATAKIRRVNGVAFSEGGMWEAGAGWNHDPDPKKFVPAVDFYRDEAANALLLESLCARKRWYVEVAYDPAKGEWTCGLMKRAFAVAFRHDDANRLMATAEAFFKLIEAGER